MPTDPHERANPAPHPPSNIDVAEVLEQIGSLLEAQDANPYRVRAYRRGAQVIRQLDQPVVGILRRHGRVALEQLEGIGTGLASIIEELADTGRCLLLERLEGQMSPEELFSTVPGIGPELAHHIHHELHIDTLEELEAAAHDGRLEAVDGFGERRVTAVRGYLQGMLGRSARRRARARHFTDHGHPDAPPVSLLLELDRGYRDRADARELPRIAPRRFNPEHHAWLPIWHVEREGWHFTLLFSNTARAHRLGKTHDWVVIFYERGGEEDQCTVVTESSGLLAGRRVVRGRERECREHYDQEEVAPEVWDWIHRENEARR